MKKAATAHAFGYAVHLLLAINFLFLLINQLPHGTILNQIYAQRQFTLLDLRPY